MKVGEEHSRLCSSPHYVKSHPRNIIYGTCGDPFQNPSFLRGAKAQRKPSQKGRHFWGRGWRLPATGGLILAWRIGWTRRSAERSASITVLAWGAETEARTDPELVSRSAKSLGRIHSDLAVIDGEREPSIDFWTLGGDACVQRFSGRSFLIHGCVLCLPVERQRH